MTNIHLLYLGIAIKEIDDGVMEPQSPFYLVFLTNWDLHHNAGPLPSIFWIRSCGEGIGAFH